MEILDPGSPMDLAQRVSEVFTAWTGQGPESVVRAPGRVNLIGEHVDYNGGPVLPLALPHATYAAARRREDGVLRLRSDDPSAEDWTGAVADLAPGAVPGWAAYAAGMVWAMGGDGMGDGLADGVADGMAQGLAGGLDLCVTSTVPTGAGLSSSAALLCAVGVAVTECLGLPLDDPLRDRLVAAGVRAESEMAGAPTGGMDQTVAMHARRGELLLVDFADGHRRRVPSSFGGAGLSLLVVDTRVSHTHTDGGFAERRASTAEAARVLGVEHLARATPEQVATLEDARLRRLAGHVVTETGRVHDAVAALEGEDWVGLGRLLGASHASLRDDYEVSCTELDVTCDVALSHGALGARMTGGGFGGSAVVLLGREHLPGVAAALEAAYADRGWRPPHLLLGEPAAGAGHC